MEDRLVRVVALLLLLLMLPVTSLAEETSKPTDLIHGSYALMYMPERDSYGEGIVLSHTFFNRSSRLVAGINHLSFRKQTSEKKDISLTIDAKGETLFGPFEGTIDVRDLSYSTSRTHNIWDFMLFGEYNYYGRTYMLGKGNAYPLKSQEVSLWVGGGGRYALDTHTAKYSLYVKDELFDSVENPLSDSNDEGIKFFVTHSVLYRFAYAHIGLTTAIGIPQLQKSFALLMIGLSI